MLAGLRRWRRARSRDVVIQYGTFDEDAWQAQMQALDVEYEQLFAELRVAGATGVRGWMDFAPFEKGPVQSHAAIAGVLERWLLEERSFATRTALMQQLDRPSSVRLTPRVTPFLIEEFRDVSLPYDYRFQVAESLRSRRDPRYLPDYQELAADPRYGDPREPLTELIAALL